MRRLTHNNSPHGKHTRAGFKPTDMLSLPRSSPILLLTVNRICVFINVTLYCANLMLELQLVLGCLSVANKFLWASELISFIQPTNIGWNILRTQLTQQIDKRDCRTFIRWIHLIEQGDKNVVLLWQILVRCGHPRTEQLERFLHPNMKRVDVHHEARWNIAVCKNNNHRMKTL